MLDIESKEILYKEFDKKKNYQAIMKNIDKLSSDEKYKNGHKVIRILPKFLIPICTVMMIVTYCNINRNNGEFNKKDNISNEIGISSQIQNSTQTIVEENNVIGEDGEKNEIEEANKTDNLTIQKEKESKTDKIDKKENTVVNENSKKDEPKENSNKEKQKNEIKQEKNIQKENKNDNGNGIYKTVQVQTASWSKDPSNPNNLLNDNTSVVKVKIISIGNAEMLPKQENFNNPYSPYTPITMEVESTISGKTLTGTIKAYIQGGKIKIGSLSNSEANNLGISNITEDMKSKYIECKTGYDYIPAVGNKYVIIITKANNNLYQIGSGGYSIFTINNNTFTNVLTKKAWEN